MRCILALFCMSIFSCSGGRRVAKTITRPAGVVWSVHVEVPRDLPVNLETIDGATADEQTRPEVFVLGALHFSTRGSPTLLSAAPASTSPRDLRSERNQTRWLVTMPDGSRMEVATDLVPIDSDWFGSRQQVLAVTRTGADVVFSAITNGTLEWRSRAWNPSYMWASFAESGCSSCRIATPRRSCLRTTTGESLSRYCGRKPAARPSLRGQARLLSSGGRGSSYGISEPELSSGTFRFSTSACVGRMGTLRTWASTARWYGCTSTILRAADTPLSSRTATRVSTTCTTPSAAGTCDRSRMQRARGRHWARTAAFVLFLAARMDRCLRSGSAARIKPALRSSTEHHEPLTLVRRSSWGLSAQAPNAHPFVQTRNC